MDKSNCDQLKEFKEKLTTFINDFAPKCNQAVSNFCGGKAEGSGKSSVNLENTSKLFSCEELQLRKQCDEDSILYRSIPLGITFAAATLMGVKKSSYQDIDSTPIVVLAGLIGYCLGKKLYWRRAQKRFEGMPKELHGKLYHEMDGLKDNQTILIITPAGVRTRVLTHPVCH